MKKFLIFILSFGFIIQFSGINLYVTKSGTKTEQCPDDNQPSEETGKAEFKKDNDHICFFLKSDLTLAQSVHTITNFMNYYPLGFTVNPIYHHATESI